MWIDSATLSRAFRHKDAHPPRDQEPAGDEEVATAPFHPDGRMDRRRSNQINKISADHLRGKSKQDIVNHLKLQYDANGDGVFQDEEVDDMLHDTIELCEMKEGLVAENSMMMGKLNKMNRRMKIMGGTGTVLIIASVLATYFGSESTFSQGTLEVKDSINKSKTTSVGVDSTGHSHLKDVQTGLDVSTRAVGDSFFSRTVIDSSGRKLKCIDLGFVAELYHDSVARTGASVVFVDENGVEQQIVPINGEFVDNGRTLTFGKGDDSVTMVMDTDVCNTGDDMLPVEDESKEGGDEVLEVAGNETDAIPSSPFDRNLLRTPDVDDPPLPDPSARVRAVEKSGSRSHKSANSGLHLTILQRNRDEYFEHRAALQSGRTLSSSSSVPVCTDDDDCENSFVGWLPCTDSWVDGGNLAANAIDTIFEPLEGTLLDSLETPDGESLSLVSVMKEELNDYISNKIGLGILLPQKVCAGADEDLATRGGNAGIGACESLDMLGETDVLAFGYYDDSYEKGICVALHDGTHTYALAQSGILPPIKINGLEITVDAIAVSITKQLTATTRNLMWNGTDDADGLALLEEMTIPGHFVLRGTGDYGLQLSSKINLALSCDATVLVDMDYANDGVAPSNGAVDFAMMLSGSLTPTFEVDVGKDGEPDLLELDFSAVFQVDADFYMYVNKDFKHVQMAVSRNLDLVQVCDVNTHFAIFCDIFQSASFSMASRAYANNDGFGAQFAFEATIEMKPGFAIVEDLINWPEDNQVELVLDITLMGERLRTCVMFENSRFCTGKCTNDSECEKDTDEDEDEEPPQVCDNVFKVCRNKRADGGKCGRDAGCLSGNCVSGYCRECPTAGSTEDCTEDDGKPANYFCQRTDGLKTHVCRPQKNNGDVSGCSGDGACKSGICVGGFCRACRTPGTIDKCTNGNVCKNVLAPTCGPKKSNGDVSGCISNTICKSGYCVGPSGAKICRECPTKDSTTGCPSGDICRDDITTGFIKKCVLKEKLYGGTCTSGSGCKSGFCVSGFCRDCPTAGSETGCATGKFCQRLTSGKLHTCQWKKDNGSTCSGDGACKSDTCLSGYCRVCETSTDCSSQYGSGYECFDNFKTGYIKKCCKESCSGKGIFRTCKLSYCKA